MRAYGIPRTKDIEYPDLADVRLYGVKGHRMKNRSARRRIWKKAERRAAKIQARPEQTLHPSSRIYG